jgi:hypothetical protein
VEVLVGAGAILAALENPSPSPEAVAAIGAYQAAVTDLPAFLERCASGRELREAGFGRDAAIAAELDVSRTAPTLRHGAFVNVLGKGAMGLVRGRPRTRVEVPGEASVVLPARRQWPLGGSRRRGGERMDRKLRVGVLGAGRWAERAHIPGWQRDGRAEVVVLGDVERGAAEELAAKFGIRRRATTGGRWWRGTTST